MLRLIEVSGLKKDIYIFSIWNSFVKEQAINVANMIKKILEIDFILIISSIRPIMK